MNKKNNGLAPIVLFVYNRPWHTRQTVEALQKNELAKESVLYVFADGPKSAATEEQLNNIRETRAYVRQITGFKEIHIEEAEKNKGLANSVIGGVTKVVNQYGKVIVLEDDLLVHPFFLRFINEALDFYAKDKRIYSIGGFNYGFPMPDHYKKDVYIVHRSESCGWGTWKDRWDNVDWSISDASAFFMSKRKQRRFNRGGEDMSNMLKMQLEGKIDSWAIRWDYHMYKHNAYCLRPVKTFVENIGFDGTGVHSGTMDTNGYAASTYPLTPYSIKLIKNIRADKEVCKRFKFFFDEIMPVTVVKRIKRIIKKVLHRFKFV